jgi:hypothetical protein
LALAILLVPSPARARRLLDLILDLGLLVDEGIDPEG